jgi:hypothetical protein
MSTIKRYIPSNSPFYRAPKGEPCNDNVRLYPQGKGADINDEAMRIFCRFVAIEERIFITTVSLGLIFGLAYFVWG